MITDVGLPMQVIGKDRNEILVVYFDGFIKNESEGLVRTMLNEYDRWISDYPKLKDFVGFTRDELYHETMLFRPIELLQLLSDNTKDENELYEDLEYLISNINFSLSKITSFEYALYQILQEKNIISCYIIKNDVFYDNEVEYITKQYNDVLDKLEIVTGGILSLFDEINPTTLFLNDANLPINIFPREYPDDKLDNKLFILLNSSQNIQCSDNTDALYYTDDFEKAMNHINENTSYGLLAMFNFPLLTDKDEEMEDFAIDKVSG